MVGDSGGVDGDAPVGAALLCGFALGAFAGVAPVDGEPLVAGAFDDELSPTAWYPPINLNAL
jgi:hypothetical protein